MIDPITNDWKPITGDDEPYYSMYYRDVPEGYRIEDLPIPDASLYPILNSNWDRLVNIANKYYRNCEINGDTILDFYENLEISLELGKDKLEKILTNLDLIVFEHGSITTRIINEDSSETETGTKTGNNADNETVNITDTETELAFDSQNNDPSRKVNKSGTDNVNHTISESDNKDRITEKGIDETTNVNRYAGENGIDYFEKLISIYPNIPKMFIDMFEDDFIIKEVIIW